MNVEQTTQNLKTIEAAWHALLPNNCYLSCGNIDQNYPKLSTVERASFADTLSTIRLSELQAGRYHAKKALCKTGILITDLPRTKESPAPHWPDNAKGSITHTKDIDSLSHIAAVATNESTIKHIGIDAEYFTDLTPNLWRTFMTKDELDWVLSIDAGLRTSLVKKIWCLKEAAIKAFSIGDMMTFNVCPDSNVDFTIFNLISKSLNNIKLKGRATEVNGLTLSLVYV